jgi:hypothetical protein
MPAVTGIRANNMEKTSMPTNRSLQVRLPSGRLVSATKAQGDSRRVSIRYRTNGDRVRVSGFNLDGNFVPDPLCRNAYLVFREMAEFGENSYAEV